MQRIRKAVILLAGYGTRCLPITKVLPKAMITILNKPIVHYITEEIEKSGLDEIIFVLPKDCNGKLVKQYFSKNKKYENFLKKRQNQKALNILKHIKTKLKTRFVYAKPNGSGGAVLKAEKFIKNKPFAVLNGDDLFVGNPPALNQIIKKFNQTNLNILGAKEIDKKDINKYGIVEIEKNGLIKKLFEKPMENQTQSRLASFGRYIFKPEIFDILKKIKPQPNGEIFLTDAINILIEKKQMHCEKLLTERFDCGNTKDILLCSIKMGLPEIDIKPYRK